MHKGCVVIFVVIAASYRDVVMQILGIIIYQTTLETKLPSSVPDPTDACRRPPTCHFMRHRRVGIFNLGDEGIVTSRPSTGIISIGSNVDRFGGSTNGDTDVLFFLEWGAHQPDQIDCGARLRARMPNF
jgi:hypothetical protein